MYILIGVLLAICFLFMLICFFRKKYIIRKVCGMEFCDKLQLLNHLAEPFGFRYVPKQDIMTSRIDAFQKKFGYCSLYDKSALKFGMVFDCEPVYFEYAGRTWRIELWKGQYGINIGAEIGIYYADTVIPPQKYAETLFHGVDETDMLPVSMCLNYRGQPLFATEAIHWWLTGFRVGSYSAPEELVLEVSIIFPNEEMKTSFVDSLCRMGYHQSEISVCCNTVSFSFAVPHTRQPRQVRHFMAGIVQWKNRCILRWYCFVTRAFTHTMDKILYLYFYLPAVFRRMLLFKKNRKQKCPRECKGKIKQKNKKRCRGCR